MVFSRLFFWAALELAEGRNDEQLTGNVWLTLNEVKKRIDNSAKFLRIALWIW